MKRFMILILIALLSQTIFSQKSTLIADKQFMLGITNVDATESVTHYINAIGEVWEKSGSSFVISSDQTIYSNSLSTTGNANFNNPDWPGFNFKWLNNYPPSGVSWGLGFYKVTNSKQSNKYFYLDARDYNFATQNMSENVDFWAYFSNSASQYRYMGSFSDFPTSIPNESIVRVWDIPSDVPNTSGLQNYWNNVLVILTDQNNPRIVWGPHPTFLATNYKVYRAVSSTPLSHPVLFASVVTTVSNDTFEYKDIDISFGGSDYIYYFVKGYNGSYSEPTNVEQVNGGFYKKNLSESKKQIFSFDLKQNYPNPFNPTTIISYSIPNNDFVSIKIYDSIGKLVSTLVNSTKEGGNYTVSFNVDNLSSGLYFYTLRISSGSITKKMLLVR
ncbi:MAG: T9SS type A sorting domain-containing protein [Bacteroidetes bacterium]|nr:T9SS type A sorting domain-containing protein [Bacteroidota bacterium]MBU1681119.1 T9SS type A sorting domain-containing protein [Bacteroidota bacterium]